MATVATALLLLTLTQGGGEALQDPGQNPWIAGFGRRLTGEVIAYESALPEARSALLVRSMDAAAAIAWETEAVPENLSGDTVSFLWLFGLDANPEQHRFELRVEGEPVLAFPNPSTPRSDPWEVMGGDGVRLRFLPARVDRHEDVFGFAVLTLPRARVQPGRPLRLELTGESAGSPVWAMTFQYAPRPRASLAAEEALRRDVAGNWRPVVLEIVHLGPPAEVTLAPSFAPKQRLSLRLGLNRIVLHHPPVSKPGTARVRITGAVEYALECPIGPVRPWTVHLVQHVHTDIGYTRPQTEILPEHLRYIDYALDYCDLTDDDPDDARFRWTCEAAWPVARYLRDRPPEQVERLRRRVAEGRIEITAMFANLSELLDERGCLASLEPLGVIRENDLPVRAAMQDDVNGIAWCYADLLPRLGVDVLVMGEHGHRALIPFDVPTLFWWEAPSGSRLLAWRPDHYHTGNFWGVHTGRIETVEPALFAYLRGLEDRGYPYDEVAVQYSGTWLDNAPPGTAACDLIRSWNERYAWPHLRSATVSELPRLLASRRGQELGVYRRAWPDWWADGIGSAPREAAAVRGAQADLHAVEVLFCMAALLGALPPSDVTDRIRAAWERLVFYGEHTYGAAESVRDPLAANSQVQWAEKSACAWEAVKEIALLREAALGLLQANFPRTAAPVLVAVNPLAHARSGLAEVFVDHALLPPDRPFRVLDDSGAEVPVQAVRRGPEGTVWGLWAAAVPAFGWRAYRVEVGTAPAATPVPSGGGKVLENGFYRLEVDPDSGAVVHLLDKDLGLDLVDPQAEWGFGQLVHERLGNRWQLERHRLDDFTRAALPVQRVEVGTSGPIWRSLRIHGGGGPCTQEGFELEIRLFATVKRIEFRYRLRKARNLDPEGLYAAFPLHLPGARVRYEVPGGVVDPERDLLPRTSSDWQAVQGFVAAEGEAGRVLVSSPEALLWQFGGLQLGRFAETPEVGRPHLYAWLFNNYWVTNFLGSEEGDLEWSFVLTSGPPGDGADAIRFGRETLHPLVTRALPPSREARTLPPPRSLLAFSAPDVILVGARVDLGALQLQVREVGGRTVSLSVLDGKAQPLRLRRTDPLGETRGERLPSVSVPARGTASFQVDL